MGRKWERSKGQKKREEKYLEGKRGEKSRVTYSAVSHSLFEFLCHIHLSFLFSAKLNVYNIKSESTCVYLIIV